MINLNEESIALYSTYDSNTLNKYRKSTAKMQSAVNREIVGEISNKSYSQMLDMGCGDGQRSSYIAHEAKIQHLKMIDNSKNMVDICKASGLKVSMTSAENFSSDRVFDVILCICNVLGHTENKEAVLLNIHKHLSPSGVAFIGINNRFNFRKYGLFALKNIVKDVMGISNGLYKLPDGFHVYIHSPFELDDTIRRLFKYKKMYFDHSTGKITSWPFGQLLYVMEKDNS